MNQAELEKVCNEIYRSLTEDNPALAVILLNYLLTLKEKTDFSLLTTIANKIYAGETLLQIATRKKYDDVISLFLKLSDVAPLSEKRTLPESAEERLVKKPKIEQESIRSFVEIAKHQLIELIKENPAIITSCKQFQQIRKAHSTPIRRTDLMIDEKTGYYKYLLVLLPPTDNREEWSEKFHRALKLLFQNRAQSITNIIYYDQQGEWKRKIPHNCEQSKIINEKNPFGTIYILFNTAFTTAEHLLNLSEELSKTLSIISVDETHKPPEEPPVTTTSTSTSETALTISTEPETRKIDNEIEAAKQMLKELQKTREMMEKKKQLARSASATTSTTTSSTNASGFPSSEQIPIKELRFLQQQLSQYSTIVHQRRASIISQPPFQQTVSSTTTLQKPSSSSPQYPTYPKL